MKKGVDAEDIVTEKARYKVVAIENEAPDYIKTTFTTISRPPTDHYLNTRSIFGGQGTGFFGKIPSPGYKSFYIDKLYWTEEYIETVYGMGLPDLVTQWNDKGSSELYVSFIGKVDSDFLQSKKYLIADVSVSSGSYF